MMLLLYRLSIGLYGFLVWIVSFFNDKAKLFVEGRKHLFERLESTKKKRNEKTIWIHAASVGEFEQGRPIIEQIKKEWPKNHIILTFFSPSGYELRKNYELADLVCYLPLDTPANARRFVELVKPDLAIFVKYEFWYFFLNELRKKQIPTLMVSCILRKDQFFFGKPGNFYLKVLGGITHYFLQDEGSAALLEKIGVNHYSIAGDTRFDRVSAVADQAKDIPVASAFKDDEHVMVLGSVWLSDMSVIQSFVLKYIPAIKFIIAPHNIDQQDIDKLLEFPESICFSKADEMTVSQKRVLIIDSIGMLSSLYRYGNYALVGGAFNGTLHNTLEPAIYGIPVFFGKDRSNVKFLEANGLIQAGGGFTFLNAAELETRFNILRQDEDLYQRAAQAAKDFVLERTGATTLVMNKIKQLL